MWPCLSTFTAKPFFLLCVCVCRWNGVDGGAVRSNCCERPTSPQWQTGRLYSWKWLIIMLCLCRYTVSCRHSKCSSRSQLRFLEEGFLSYTYLLSISSNVIWYLTVPKSNKLLLSKFMSVQLADTIYKLHFTHFVKSLHLLYVRSCQMNVYCSYRVSDFV